jgi:hypothetical protein
MPRRWLLETLRTPLYHLYLRHYCRLRPVSPRSVDNWLVPVTAARLDEAIPEETDRLIARLARSSF